MLCPENIEGEVVREILCPENIQGEGVPNENKDAEDKICKKKNRKVPAEGSGSLELNSFKNPKTWKKSITRFFRNQIRSTRSNDGDRPSGSNEHFVEKDISPEQKWQSLGKMFRRQNLLENWNKTTNQEESSPKKGLAVKKVLSSYFGKSQKSSPPPSPDEK